MKRLLLVIMVVCSMILSGCVVQKEGEQDVMEVAYEEAGYAVKGRVEKDGTIVVTYAFVGMKENVIKYLYLDQIEQSPQQDQHLLTNRELQSAYGLAEESECGEWNEQVAALESYIKGNNMTLEDVNSIPVYEKDDEHLKVPEEGTGLGVVCELDLTDFLDVINEACNNLEETQAQRLGVGEDIRVSKKNNSLDIQLAFMGTNERYKICYAEFETYSIVAEPGAEVVSVNQQTGVDEYDKWNEGVEGFKDFIYGLNMVEAIGVETYDPGNGVETALPKKGTDLAEVCNIDLSKILLALQEAGNRF